MTNNLSEGPRRKPRLQQEVKPAKPTFPPFSPAAVPKPAPVILVATKSVAPIPQTQIDVAAVEVKVEEESERTNSAGISSREELDRLVRRDSNDPRVVMLFQEVRDRAGRYGISAEKALARILKERQKFGENLTKRTLSVGRQRNASAFATVAIASTFMNLLIVPYLAVNGVDRATTLNTVIYLNTILCVVASVQPFLTHRAGVTLLSGGVAAVAKHVLVIMAGSFLLATCSVAFMLWAMSTAPVASILRMLFGDN